MNPSQHARYAAKKFEPYKFEQYPLYIENGPHGRPVTVNNEEEHTQLLERMAKTSAKIVVDKDVNGVKGAEEGTPEYDELAARAKKLKLAIDKRWGVAKLKAAVEAAEALRED